MEILSDYDCNIQYHERKANVVADALSSKYHEKQKRIRALRLNLQIDLIEQLKNVQTTAIKDDAEGIKIRTKELEKGTDGIWKFHKKRIWVPIQNLRN